MLCVQDPAVIDSAQESIDAYLADKQRMADEVALKKELSESAGCR